MDSAQADLEKAKSQLKIDTLDMERNTVANRLAGYELVETSYYRKKIAIILKELKQNLFW